MTDFFFNSSICFLSLLTRLYISYQKILQNSVSSDIFIIALILVNLLLL